MRTSEQIKAEIEAKMGFFPPFFGPAQFDSQVLENLWQQTLTAYINNPLSTWFKEKFAAYLSRYYAASYCLIYHSCCLYALGMKAGEILAWLQSPPPTPRDIERHLQAIAIPKMQQVLPPQCLLECLLDYAILMALEPMQADVYQQQLSQLLGSDYQHLVKFVAYVKTCHRWVAAHPQVNWATDKRVATNLAALLQEEPRLADFLPIYPDWVQQGNFTQLSQPHKLSAPMMDNLWEYWQNNDGKPNWQRRQVNLIAVISAAINAISFTAQAKNIQIKSLLDSTAALVLGDAEQLQQVCWHLLHHMMEFAPADGRVEVRLLLETRRAERQQQQIPWACIEVRVPSQSISVRSLPRVCVIASAEPPPAQPSQSWSANLAIARHLVELHGGTIDIGSPQAEQGMNCTVKLPLFDSKKAELATQEDSCAADTLDLSTSLLSDLRILVVDDEADNRNHIVTVLEQSGAEVKAITCAVVALEVLSQWKPHLLIGNVAMPAQNGYTLIHQVRQLTPDRGGKVPAVAITARASAAESFRALTAGFQLHIPKPVAPSQLAVVVAALTGRNTQF